MEGNSWKILIYEGEILANHDASLRCAMGAGTVPPAESSGWDRTSRHGGVGIRGTRPWPRWNRRSQLFRSRASIHADHLPSPWHFCIPPSLHFLLAGWIHDVMLKLFGLLFSNQMAAAARAMVCNFGRVHAGIRMPSSVWMRGES